MRRTAPLALLLVLACGLAPSPGAARADASPLRAAIAVGAHPYGSPVPPDFLGLSYEVGSIAELGGFADGGNLVGFLRSLGTGVLRLGGATADTRAAWTPDGAQPPPWATAVVRPADLDAIGRLARLSGWRVLLTLNLGHYDPQAAQQEAGYASQAIGASLAGFEFGNEPDALEMYGLRPAPWTFAQYRSDIDAYRALVGAAAPSVPFAGPDQASGRRGLGWLVDEAVDERPALLTAHYYPLAWCVGYHPTLGDLVSRSMRAAENRMLPRIAAVARRHGIPLRIDETNNISCGGEPGVSNTFSSALWATDFLARVMRLGVAGVNLHGHLANFVGYSPLAAPSPEALAAGALVAQPEWYALLLARHLLGDRPLPVTLHPGALDVSAYAFASAEGRLHLLIVDDRPPGSRALQIAARVGDGYTAGVALTLSAPSLGATTGVTLGARTVTAGGGWSAAPALPRVPVRGGVATITTAPSSAVLVSLPPRAHR